MTARRPGTAARSVRPGARPATRVAVGPAARVVRPAHAAAALGPAGCAVLTVSDTRTQRDDPGGDAIAQQLVRAGHHVVRRAWARDDVRAIRVAARRALADPGVDAVIATGGTGMAPRDVTPEALEPLLDRRFPGFGECFRMLSWEQVGSAAWLSRAGAGTARGKPMFWLPGSPAGAALALRVLILPELGHVLRLLERPPARR